MEPRMRASGEQFSTLLEFMESHGDLSNPRSGLQGRLKSERLWSELVTILNSIGGGVNKSVEKWKKVWADWKSKTKKKALLIRRHASGTGGGPSNRQTLSSFEERVLAIMGNLAVEGLPSIQEQGFAEPLQLIQSPTQATRNSPPATHQQDAISFEYIIANEPVPISPPAPVTPPSASWPLQSETLAPSTITSQTQSARRSFVQPAPPAPSTPPPTRRRRLSSTPRSGVTASPARTTFMARRRRTLTPFDRATSEFVAIERLRLRQEEKRDRQLHERETRRIEVDRERNQVDHERNQIDHERNQVDHERNLVLSRLGDIAQAWFDHYRSKEDTERIGTP